MRVESTAVVLVDVYNDEVWRSSDSNTHHNILCNTVYVAPNIQQRNLIIKCEIWTENVAFVKVDDEDLINNFLAEQGFLFWINFLWWWKLINKNGISRGKCFALLSEYIYIYFLVFCSFKRLNLQKDGN